MLDFSPEEVELEDPWAVEAAIKYGASIRIFVEADLYPLDAIPR